ncbi:right-handed parallel beta-helix repeat-containing protein [Pontibacter cellulosilyticus]|uniref:Right-handed parallel beta-helix repeat-containing protein n=1 Tax=Pontibacter cellulosilyticus TaxID=1720253 RepID=A0A923N975_9BACT|nr:right-handed parallel beta-helix repeat-containing protein [Pontibacter cellulosilyticus]MBC5993691.1 right-handed parallel beta-helix repeat-containing protein [Pontibacter cellulosilyticus]
MAFTKSIATILLLVFSSLSVAAKTYYISSAGSDQNTGLSPASAWYSISKVNSHTYYSGDTILFESGSTFNGSLYLHKGNLKQGDQQVVISSYGPGKANIEADTSFGLYAYNVSNLDVSQLAFTGNGYQTNQNTGILFYNDLPGDTKLNRVRIHDVEVSGFRDAGIAIGSWNGNSGYSDVSITKAIVYDVGSEGITSWGFFSQSKKGYSHQNIFVGSCHVYKVYGLAKQNKHSGSGIVLSDVDGATIEHSVVHSSGSNNIHCGGPVGIWAWDANKVIIQFNEVYNMQAGSGCDGGGFDLDGGTTNSVLQYNYSHDNDGPGFLAAQFEWARPMHHNTIRYNISQNDGRKNNYKGISLWVAPANTTGGISQLYIHNNTVFADGAVVPSGGGFRIMSSGLKDVEVWNNIFYTDNGATLLAIEDTINTVRFRSNNLYSKDGTPLFIVGDKTYTDPQQLQQHTSINIADAQGLFMQNPRLRKPGKGKTVGYPGKVMSLNAYKLKARSSLQGKGVWPEQLQLSPGAHDFFLNPLPRQQLLDIGAHQRTKE